MKREQKTENICDIGAPELTDILRVRELEVSIGKEAHRCLHLRPSASCLFFRACNRAVSVAVAAFFVMLMLYLPDYIFDYSKRDGNFLQFFLKFIISCLVIVLVIAFASVLVNPRSVYIDLTAKRFVFARLLNDWTFGREYVDFCDVKSIELVPADGMSATYRVSLLANGEYYCVAESRRESDDIEKLQTWLNEICGDKARPSKK